MILILNVFKQYEQLIIKNQDEQLFHLAKAVDKNINRVLENYSTNLNYIIKRPGFLEAEKIWRESGETEVLQERLENNLLTQNSMTEALLVVKDSEVVISTNEKRKYTFIENAASEPLIYCIDEENNIYMVFVCEGEDSVKYLALINLDAFYNNIVGDELAKYDWVLLTDQSSEILLYHQQENVQVEQVDAISSATCGQEGVDIFLNLQENQIVDAASYDYIEQTENKKYAARMITIPSEQTENKEFAIGVVTNFEDVMKPLRRLGIELLCYGGTMAAAIIWLLRAVIRYKKRNERDMEELQILREKNEIMEELNQKTKEFAHHQRLEIIGTLTSGIVHEFNNLLTPIMSYSVMTLEQLSPENEELYDNILEIYQASKKAKEITTRLSELSHKDISAASQKIQIEHLIQKVKHVVRPIVPEQVEMTEEINCKDCYIIGNETQLSQMLINLIINAFHAMEVCGGTLTISAYTEEKWLVLVVKDTGVGIPENIKENIFEPFFTTKETGKGTGLGLAIVEQVVSDHQGELTVESVEGEGCTFIIKFPLRAEVEGF